MTHRQVDTVVIRLAVPGDITSGGEIDRDECEDVLSTGYAYANDHEWAPVVTHNAPACPLEPD